jgi:beta-lactam-binding protein with PASTA domain
MPSLVGRSLADARRILDDRGLVIADVRMAATAEAEPGFVIEQSPAPATRMRPGQIPITLTVTARPGEENTPPRAPVITAVPQPTEAPPSPPPPTPRRSPVPRPTPPGSGSSTASVPSPVTPPGVIRQTRVQVVVPQGATQDVRIVVIDETGVHTVYKALHAPGDRIEQLVRSQGYTIIQIYIDNRLVQELRA